VVDVRCPSLVGRESELAALRDRLGRAAQGGGAVVFLSGEPGLGKSRLVAELVRLASGDACTVLTGRAVPSARQAAYRPLAEALAATLRANGLPADPALSPWLPALRVMVPALAPPEDNHAAEAGAHVCGEALLQLLEVVRRNRPVLLVLEDLHWADPDTVGVVEYLADNLHAVPVLCLVTLRTEPATPVWELARRASQRHPGSHLRLGRLSDESVVQMVTACVPTADDELVARVQGTAEGVPLLVEELLATPGLPASVEEAVRTRVAGLDPDDQAVLYAAAMLGRDFDWQLLAPVSGHSTPQVTGALERMVAAMLVTVDGDGFRFHHALTHEAVRATLLPPRPAAFARTVLAALDRVRPRHGHADLVLLAGDRSRAGRMLAEAGRASMGRGALGSAAAALRRALELLDDPASRTDAQAALVEALALAGRIDEALAVGDELLARLGTGDAAAAPVHLELARAAISASRWPVAQAHLDTARGVLAARPDPRLAARAQALEAEVALNADELDRARRLATAAEQAARQLGAPTTRCHALELIGRSHRVQDEHDAARAAFSLAYRTADEADLPLWRLRALHELGTEDTIDHADPRPLRVARETAVGLGAHSVTAYMDVHLAAAHAIRFEIAESMACARRAADLSGRLSMAHLHAVALHFIAHGHAMRGQREPMERHLAQALREAPDDPEIRGLVDAGATAILELLWGDRSAALTAFDRGIAQLSQVTAAPGLFWGLWALLHAVEGLPDATECVALTRASKRTRVRGNRGLLRYAEAVLERSPDRVADGDEDLRYHPVWRDIGRMLVAEAALAGDWGDPQRWLTEARECFDHHGLHHLARHCTRELARLGHTPRRLPPGVTAREAEVLGLVATGLANKQIAGRLHLSVRTVEKHVESLLRKSGARSRAQLVAMVGETT
jgi:DNA-binding CsgD family transcriptional regulator/tetratricopeptide (TPR) repeat protein